MSISVAAPATPGITIAQIMIAATAESTNLFLWANNLLN
jgi:hypothetical protein